jgi:hypothetical protein
MFIKMLMKSEYQKIFFFIFVFIFPIYAPVYAQYPLIGPSFHETKWQLDQYLFLQTAHQQWVGDKNVEDYTSQGKWTSLMALTAFQHTFSFPSFSWKPILQGQLFSRLTKISRGPFEGVHHGEERHFFPESTQITLYFQDKNNRWRPYMGYGPYTWDKRLRPAGDQKNYLEHFHPAKAAMKLGLQGNMKMNSYFSFQPQGEWDLSRGSWFHLLMQAEVLMQDWWRPPYPLILRPFFFYHHAMKGFHLHSSFFQRTSSESARGPYDQLKQTLLSIGGLLEQKISSKVSLNFYYDQKLWGKNSSRDVRYGVGASLFYGK